MLSDYFRTIRVNPGQILYRISEVQHKCPFYFGTDPDREKRNRYDSPLSTPNYGVCYLAYSSLGAYLEKFGRPGKSSIGIDGYQMYIIEVIRPLIVLNLPDTQHLGRLRIESSYYMGSDYNISQRLSLLVYQCNLDGINSILRHSMERQQWGLSVFGQPYDSVDSMRIIDIDAIPDDVVEEAEELYRTDLITDNRPATFDAIAAQIRQEQGIKQEGYVSSHQSTQDTS